jgi:hypothetical protein
MEEEERRGSGREQFAETQANRGDRESGRKGGSRRKGHKRREEGVKRGVGRGDVRGGGRVMP